MNVYFDNAATSPLRPEVIQSMHEVMQGCFGNPSSTHGFGRTAKTHIESARKSMAAHFNALPQEIVFTSGGTESNNMLLRAAVEDLGVQTIISSKIEHHAVLHTLDHLAEKGVEILYVPIHANGQICYTTLQEMLASCTTRVLVSLMHVNNEIGTILDLPRVSQMCQEYKALFHTDAVQGVGHFEIDLSALPIDFLSAAAHKFHGPKGIGFSFVRRNTGIKPFILGGGQERGLRAGTESVHNIVGMAKALELSYAHLAEESQQIQTLKAYAQAAFKKHFEGVRFNGCCDQLPQSTYTLINVNLPIQKDKSALLDFHLDLNGIACSKGSACQSGASTGSHVLNEILTEEELKHPSLRFSFSIFNTQEEVDYLISTLKKFITA